MNFPKKISLEWCKKNTESALGPESEIDDRVTKMPFGKHKGTPMNEVPVQYLNWLWLNGMNKKKGSVANYIRDNLITLKKQYPYDW